jgi:S-DNA-T family DNA segregation ATPase FtsK/SpoIIIE
MILADAADRGARPQDLRPGADAGTVVATGEVEDIPNGQAFALCVLTTCPLRMLTP